MCICQNVSLILCIYRYTYLHTYFDIHLVLYSGLWETVFRSHCLYTQTGRLTIKLTLTCHRSINPINPRHHLFSSTMPFYIFFSLTHINHGGCAALFFKDFLPPETAFQDGREECIINAFVTEADSFFLHSLKG